MQCNQYVKMFYVWSFLCSTESFENLSWARRVSVTSTFSPVSLLCHILRWQPTFWLALFYKSEHQKHVNHKGTCWSTGDPKIQKCLADRAAVEITVKRLSVWVTAIEEKKIVISDYLSASLTCSTFVPRIWTSEMRWKSHIQTKQLFIFDRVWLSTNKEWNLFVLVFYLMCSNCIYIASFRSVWFLICFSIYFVPVTDSAPHICKIKRWKTKSG